jgi:serralysin
MCQTCIQRSLETWQRFEEEQRDAANRQSEGTSRGEWARMSAAEQVNGKAVSAPAPARTDPQQAGTGEGGSANGVSQTINQAMVDWIAAGSDGIEEFWYTSTGAVATTITYGFTTSSTFATGFGERSGWSAFSSDQQATARLAISLWDDLVAATFVEATNGNTADIKFSNTTTNIGYAHAYFPGEVGDESYNFARISGSVWLNSNYDASQESNDLMTPPIGSHGFSTYVHELGHALGLEHTGNYNGGNPQYGDGSTGWLFAEDSTQYSIMSYFDESNTGANFGTDWTTWAPWGWGIAAQTPMVYDILAIQQLYGADYTTRAGNTVYGFNSNTNSPIYDFSINSRPALTIWDGDGTDTIDLSGWSTGATLSLVAGSYSSVNGGTYNLAIAFDVDIENGIGGSGNDTLHGNDLANTLTGNAGADILNGNGGDDTLFGGLGNDTLNGGDGNDTLDGGAGADVLNGGGGFDIASYRSATSGISLFVGNAAMNTGDAAGDTYLSIEAYEGSNFDDTLVGGSGNDFLFGGGGNDTLFGGTGNDTLFGGTGADHFDGGDGFDQANYSTATAAIRVDLSNLSSNLGEAAGDTFNSVEMISGSAFGDVIIGDDSANWLFGNDGDDQIFGGAGNDSLFGGAGADVLDGGAGFDLASYQTAGTGVTIDLQNPLNNTGDAQGDTYISIEMFAGSNFADVIVGSDGRDYLFGNAGDDVIDGQAGNDFIYAGPGNDILTGGAGSDTFVFNSGETGDNTITDFEDGLDILRLTSYGYASDAEVLALVTSEGSGIRISFDAASSVFLANFAISNFDGSDFII